MKLRLARNESCTLTTLNLKGLYVNYIEVSRRQSGILVLKFAECLVQETGLNWYLSCGINVDYRGGGWI